MKKTCRFARYVLSLLSIACFSGIAFAAPYGPEGREIKWVQPNGEQIKLRVFGDDFYARTETVDGFTVVYNPADKAYYYAEVNANGTALKPSGRMAHRPVNNGLKKRVDLPEDRIRQIYQTNRTRFAGERNARWSQRVQAIGQLNAAKGGKAKLGGPQLASAQIKAAPVEGNKVGLTILAQFPNDTETDGRDPVDFPVTRAAIVDFCNKQGYSANGNSGSVRDYFFDQSLGKVTYTQKVTQVVTLPRARNYYNYDDYPTNNVLRDTGEAGRMLIADAVSVLRTEGFDFAGLTRDDTGNAIATNLFFAGADSGVWAAGLWPHQWNLAQGLNVGTVQDPIYLYNYQVTNIDNASPVIGTFCHENGHLLIDYPDIYDIFGEGVGEHCLMGSGNYLNDGKTPSPINAHFKDMVGWANVTELAVSEYVTKSLPTTGNVSYRIRKPGTATESFIVENRGKGDKWAEYSNDKGIAIWHIDETVDGNIGSDPYMVALEQADGGMDLERGLNRGDSTDLFDLASPLFSDTTIPDSNWWDGNPSGVRVKVLTGVGSKTSVQFGKLPPNTIIIDSPNGGEVMYRESTFAIKWEANIIGGVKIELYNGASFLSTISNNTENSGSFDWDVPKGLQPGTNYRIRISSVSNPTNVVDFSDASFSVTDSTFPPGNKMPYGWKKASGAATSWEVTKSQVFEGSHSLKSKNPGDGKTSGISYTSNFKAGTISFYMRVSSELGYDYATFYIDGVRQFLPSATSKRGITGRRDWAFASFKLPAGKHTLTWSFEKDDSYAEGQDSAWIDGVLLPDTTQEIGVENERGFAIISGRNTTTFESVRIGSESKPQTFTVRNNGKADLYGLRVETKGEYASSFKATDTGKKILKPGDSTTFTVTFAPSKTGKKTAQVRILSNDPNESPFVITVEGRALGIPGIAVYQPEDEKLKDGKSVVKFGFASINEEGKTKLFTVVNTGSAAVEGLEVTKSGANKGDFEIRAIGSRTILPGESTTFKVTFNPKKQDERLARLHIKFDYAKAGSFNVDLTGSGAPKNLAKASKSTSKELFAAVFGSAQAAPLSTSSVSSVTVDGSKYLSLTVAVGDGVAPTVEVSPNLVDWFSGSAHTTILTENESFRTVRDNTPVTPGVKRYIRVKSTP
jgi:M6 family metalloprotease-like protein